MQERQHKRPTTGLVQHRCARFNAGLAVALLVMFTSAVSVGETIGKNPGKIKGRWLRVDRPEQLKNYKSVYLGDITADIQWKETRNEAPIEEDLLAEHLHDELLARLKESRVLGDVLETAPALGEEGALRIDAEVVVEPGSRAARYFVGLGAGKSRSILEVTLTDHATGEAVGLYHGHGIGSGAGFKLAGGGARKMTQDDNQENAKKLVQLLDEIRD